jgi:BlaI family transcriptional regulator, penicillinase repressor
MARPKSTGGLTPLELEIMMVLWKTGPASVQTVQEGLPQERNLTYSTVQTMLNLLVKKAKATREREGRAFHYRPSEDRSSAVRSALKDIIDRMFGGSAEDLVVGLVETRQLNPARLLELHKTLRPGKEKRDGRG